MLLLAAHVLLLNKSRCWLVAALSWCHGMGASETDDDYKVKEPCGGTQSRQSNTGRLMNRWNRDTITCTDADKEFTTLMDVILT